MKQLSSAKHDGDVEACAAEVVDVGLAVSRLVRAQMRRKAPRGFTLPQIRALAFVNADPACSPSQLAEYLMLSRPAVTRLLDGVVASGLMTRRAHPDDRRRLQLAVTRAGRARLEAYFAGARAIVAERLTALPPNVRASVRRAMQVVRPLVAGAPPPSSHGTG
jgi:DNA-binding MarR family transcriptional regulator